MGRFRPFTGYIAYQYLYYITPIDFGTPQTRTVPTYYDTSGAAINTIYQNTLGLCFPVNYHAANNWWYASSESESLYNKNNYAVNNNSNLSTSIQRAMSYDDNKGENFIVLTISNSSSTSQTVTNIRYVKNTYYAQGSGINVLMWAYYFDEPIEVPANSRINVKFKITKNFDL